MMKKGNSLHSSVAASNETTAEWKLVRLRDLGKWSGGGTPSKANPAFWENGTIPWVSPKDMKIDRIFTAEDLITEAAVKGSTTNLVPAGSILMVTRSGILRHTFPVAVTELPVTLNQDLKALTLAPGVLPKYVLFALKAFSQDILHTCSKQGTTVNSIETAQLLSFRIPLAPPALQAEIVAEIEKQSSRLDQTVTALKRIQANLRRYKAAVLKAAVEGKLTEQWRKEHPDVEPADQLLKRILAERRANWEAEELGKMNAKGINPKDDGWKKKYKEPTRPSTSNMFELPSEWGWVTIEQLSLKVQYGTSSKTSENPNGVPVLRMGNLFEGNLRLDNLKYLPSDHGEFPELLLDENDLLFNRTNSPELVGKTAIYLGHPSPCSFASYLIRVKFGGSVSAKLVSCYISSIYGRKWVTSVVSQQVGQANVNGTKLQALAVPLPTFEEQRCIVAEIDRRLSVTEELEASVERNLKRAERLRQTILHQAFSSGLV